jgi:hypothetical protein
MTHIESGSDDGRGNFQIHRYGVLGASRPSLDWLVVASKNVQYARNVPITRVATLNQLSP